MALDTTFSLRLQGDLKRELEKIARKAGLSESAIMRGNLRLTVDLPQPKKKLTLLEIARIAKKEREGYLFGKNKCEDDGKEGK